MCSVHILCIFCTCKLQKELPPGTAVSAWWTAVLTLMSTGTAGWIYPSCRLLYLRNKKLEEQIKFASKALVGSYHRGIQKERRYLSSFLKCPEAWDPFFFLAQKSNLSNRTPWFSGNLVFSLHGLSLVFCFLPHPTHRRFSEDQGSLCLRIYFLVL